MAQSDYIIGANPSGLAMRTEINTIFDSILTNNSGSTAPTATSPFMMWVDTSNATYYYLKMRNHDDTAWVTLGTYTVATKTYISFVDDDVKLTGNQTIHGIKTFSTSPIVPTPTTTGNVITMDNIVQKTAVGVGYGTGSGGTVTQLTSKSTAVTLNKPTGQITMNNSSLATNTAVSFVLNNNTISANDMVVPNIKSGFATNNTYRCWAEEMGVGSCKIVLENRSGGTLSEAIVLTYSIIKGANS